MTDIKEIVGNYLLNHGQDGLFSDDRGCACSFDDLMPCGEPLPGCAPGYAGPCTCGESCDQDIYPTKEGAAWAKEVSEEDDHHHISDQQ